MANFHPKFPFGKGLWIWQLAALIGQYGVLDAVVQKCVDFNISYVMIKCGDGRNTMETIEYYGKTYDQWNPTIIQAFKSRGIKVLSWSYVYGQDPLREAAIANWALDMGAEGHVFDAETEYEKLPNNGAAAKQMLDSVRAKHPEAFLAHAPYPIIDGHKSFPYIEFGEQCDAVMPQMYWGTIYNKDVSNKPDKMINWTYDNWSRWQQAWIDSGHPNAVKPLIPVGQGYDNDQVGYTLSSTEMQEFISQVAGYKSVNFWSFQHILRDDCWNALKTTQVSEPPAPPTPPTQPVIHTDPVVTTPPVVPTPQNNTPLPQTINGGEVTPPVVSVQPVQEQGSTMPQTTISGTTQPSTLPSSGGTSSYEPPVIPSVVPCSNPAEKGVSVYKQDGEPYPVFADRKHIDYLLAFLAFIKNLLNKKLW